MERSAIHPLRKRGKSLRQIAAELGHSKTTIARALSDWHRSLLQLAAEFDFHPVGCWPEAPNQKSSVESLVKLGGQRPTDPLHPWKRSDCLPNGRRDLRPRG